MRLKRKTFIFIFFIIFPIFCAKAISKNFSIKLSGGYAIMINKGGDLETLFDSSSDYWDFMSKVGNWTSGSHTFTQYKNSYPDINLEILINSKTKDFFYAFGIEVGLISRKWNPNFQYSYQGLAPSDKIQGKLEFNINFIPVVFSGYMVFPIGNSFKINLGGGWGIYFSRLKIIQSQIYSLLDYNYSIGDKIIFQGRSIETGPQFKIGLEQRIFSKFALAIDCLYRFTTGFSDLQGTVNWEIEDSSWGTYKESYDNQFLWLGENSIGEKKYYFLAYDFNKKSYENVDKFKFWLEDFVIRMGIKFYF